MDASAEEKAEIDRLTASFFALFSNRGGLEPDLDRIFDLFVPEGVIARCEEAGVEVWSVAGFIGPRRELLTSGTLTDFCEKETGERTSVDGALAHRVSTYEKSGVRDGVAFTARGMKMFQFIRTPAGWRMLSVAWEDE